MRRGLLLLILLIIAAGAPIAYFTWKDPSRAGRPFWSDWFARRDVTEGTKAAKYDPLIPVNRQSRMFERDPELEQLLRPPITKRSMVVEPVVTPLPEVLRFDMSPASVAQRWPRVSSQLAQLDYQGMRVPIVTGVSPDDFHGSASYFFNRSHQLERIDLHGYTKNPDELIQFVTTMYKLQEYAATGQRLFLSYLNGQPLSMLRIQNSSITGRSVGESEVILEINAPVQGAKLSESSLGHLRSLRQAHLL